MAESGESRLKCASSLEALNAGELEERFVLERVISDSPFSRVLLVRDLRSGERVVMKVLPAQEVSLVRRRFEREIQTLARIDHPAIVAELENGVLHDGAPYFTMPFLAGAVPLSTWLGTPGRPREREVVLRLTGSLAAGLGALHHASIVHRDIKPSNILVEDGRGLWIDLGLARTTQVDRTALTQEGALVGTILYLSPEMARGEPAGPASDLYQLALVMYQLIVGRPHHDDPLEYYHRLAAGLEAILSPRLVAPWLAPGLASFLEKALDPRPGARFTGAQAMHAALEAIPPAAWQTSGSGVPEVSVTEVLTAVGVPVPDDPSPDAPARPATPGMAALERALPDRYRVTRLLGAGGEGTVLLCQDRALKREVAIKFPHAPAETGTEPGWLRFIQQARLMGRLSHPAIVHIFDIVEGDLPFIVFEYVPGPSLDQVVTDTGPLPAARVSGLAVRLAGALDALHGAGVMHRDIKPANIILMEGSRTASDFSGVGQIAPEVTHVTPEPRPPGAGGSPILIDLGMARDLASVTRITRTGIILGTPRYMPPELLQTGDSGPAGDHYSLGVTLYRCLTGRHPFPDDLDGLIAAKMKGEFAPLATHGSYPAPLVELIESLLAKEPARRPASGARIEEILRGGSGRRTGKRPGRKTGPEGVFPAKASVKRPRARAPILVLLGLLGLLGAGLARRHRATGVEVSIRSTITGLDGVQIELHREPPGPLTLRQLEPGRPDRVLTSTDDAPDHRFFLVAPAEGTPIKVVPEADSRTLPQISIPDQPARPRNCRWDGHQFSFELGTVTRTRCRVRALPAGTHPFTDWSEEGQVHPFSFPDSTLPFALRWEVEIATGSESRTREISLDNAQRARFFGGMIDWFAAREDARVGPILRNPKNYGEVEIETYRGIVGVIDKLSETALPAWFLREIGGATGVLGLSTVTSEDRDRFYRALWNLEFEQEARDLLRLPRDDTYQVLYSSEFGGRRTPRHPDARVLPIKSRPFDGSKAFDVAIVMKPYPGGSMEPPAGNTACLEGEVDLPGGLPRFVEIHARLRLLPGRLIQVTINDHWEVRLGRFAPDFPFRESADVYYAFDPRYLVPGKNRFQFRCPMLPQSVMVASIGFGVTVEPPGFDLRVVPP